jgi:hypothetical protein
MKNEETDQGGQDISAILLECLLNQELSIEERVRRAQEVAAIALKEINGDKYGSKSATQS